MKGIPKTELYIDIQNRITIQIGVVEIKKSEEEIIYHMELINDLLNGGIPDEKKGVVLEYLTTDEHWREVLSMEILLRELGRKMRGWN